MPKTIRFLPCVVCKKQKFPSIYPPCDHAKQIRNLQEDKLIFAHNKVAILQQYKKNAPKIK